MTNNFSSWASPTLTTELFRRIPYLFVFIAVLFGLAGTSTAFPLEIASPLAVYRNATDLERPLAPRREAQQRFTDCCRITLIKPVEIFDDLSPAFEVAMATVGQPQL